jgi:hypothetical protein
VTDHVRTRSAPERAREVLPSGPHPTSGHRSSRHSSARSASTR